MSDWNDEEYAYMPAPTSRLAGTTQDCTHEELEDLMDWGEFHGMRKLIALREGANFVQVGRLWLVPVTGGQPIHHDRHILSEEDGSSHTWNIVCSGEGDQILVTEVAQDMFNHIPLTRGSIIYLNTLNRHLVSRAAGDETCVLLQMSFPEEVDLERAMTAMIAEWRVQTKRK
jgi:hypothetical protein